MDRTADADRPAAAPWRAPLTVVVLTVASIGLFGGAAWAIDRAVDRFGPSWWVRLWLPDGTFDLRATILIPFGTLVIVGIAFAAELAQSGWQRSALRRILFLATPTARTDLFYFLLRLSGLMHVAAFVLTFGLSFAVANLVSRWLRFDLLTSVESLTWQFVIVVLVNTFVFYWAHRLMHTSGLFEIHKVHHSARELNVLTNLRNHPVDFVIMMVINSAPAAILGADVIVVLAYLFVYGLYQTAVHSEIQFLEFKTIRAIIITPAAHKIHHSSSPAHYGKNFGMLTLWEVLFGTYHSPVPYETLVLGVEDNESFNTDRPVGELVAVMQRWIRRNTERSCQ